MRKLHLAGVILCLMTGGAFGQASRLAIQSQPAHDGTPAWHLGTSFPDPGGFTLVDADGTVHVIPRDERKKYRGAYGSQGANQVPNCSHSPMCGRKDGFQRGELARVEWDQNMGYKFSYPYVVPKGIGGIPSVALDSKGYLWVLKRAPEGTSQLYKFDPNHKLVLSVPENVLGHLTKAHGMAVDSQDHVWVTDNGESIVMELSSEGKLLRTIGTRNHRGDWVEDKGQRLLWQPVMIAFGPKGDIYIGEGHANESPNDVGSDDPTNQDGVARVIHLDKDGKFVGQWFGNEVGQGKFDSTHGLAVDPTNGDVWIGDREQYRIVIYTADGRFKKTLQMRNLVCAINFDHQGNPWMASGQDGQFLKLDRDGHVLGAVGNGMGIGKGQFIEASYWSFTPNDDLIAGDTSVGRVTVMRK